MNITLEIKAPGLEKAITTLAAAISGSSVQTAPVEPVKEVATEAPAKKAPAKKAAKKKAPVKEVEAEVVQEEEVPELTQADLIPLAKQLCEITGGNQKVLRATLDEAGIKGEKISTCDPKFYPAIKAGIEAAIEANDM